MVLFFKRLGPSSLSAVHFRRHNLHLITIIIQLISDLLVFPPSEQLINSLLKDTLALGLK